MDHFGLDLDSKGWTKQQPLSVDFERPSLWLFVEIRDFPANILSPLVNPAAANAFFSPVRSVGPHCSHLSSEYVSSILPSSPLDLLLTIYSPSSRWKHSFIFNIQHVRTFH